MNCKKVVSRLPAHLDGELPETLMREFEEHLRTCSSCRTRVDAIRRMEAMLDGFTVPPLPQGFSSRVMAEARRGTGCMPESRCSMGEEWLPWRWFADLTVAMRFVACATILVASLMGMFMSRDLFISGGPQARVAAAENLDGLEWFSLTPPASLGSAYLSLALSKPGDRGAR